MKKEILVLDNYDSFTYNLVNYIEKNPSINVHVFRNDEIEVKDIEKYDAIVLSPGPGVPKDAGILCEVIEKYAGKKKMLGVCLGMQAIAEVFGGELINLDKVYHGVATPITVTNTSDELFNNLPEQFNVGRYHSWAVKRENIPADLMVTSESSDGQTMSVKHKDFPIYGVQFHPESILTEHGQEMIDNFLAI